MKSNNENRNVKSSRTMGRRPEKGHPDHKDEQEMKRGDMMPQRKDLKSDKKRMRH